MPITATYTPAQLKLSVLGTLAAEGIIVSRNAGGTLLVNAGAVPITGGTATVANTSVIEVLGDAGADTIALDETNGALPAAELYGGAGNDSLSGGSNVDALAGEADDDTLLGKGGNDLLFGGSGNDTLTGGDGEDEMFGDDGNDRMIWNPGDDSDVMEGGNGSDVAEVNGGGGDEVFTVTANGTRVRFDRLAPAPFALDIGTTESLVLNAGGGNDQISTSGNLAPLISLTLDGGAGNDTILAGNGVDTILGGDGNDFVDGNQGSDTAFLGAGNDVFQWDPGDGSDTIEGQADADTLLFNGSAANENFEIAANGGRVRFTRTLGTIIMDVNDVEAFTVNALGGIDTFTVNDLAGTDATGIVLNLAGTIGGTTGDTQADTLIVNGSNTANAIDVTGSGTGFAVSGLTATITVANSEGANDQLTVNGLGGGDSIVATMLAAGVVELTIDGGADNDTILGSQGADTLFGGDGNDTVLGDNGNDTAFLGAGNDVFEWAPGDGSDVVEGQADLDELRFIGSNASESINIAPNGGRILFSRDVAAVTMDLNDVERIRFDAFAGADNIIVGDLSATDATNIELRLAASGGGGDGAVDTVTVNGSAAGDGMAISSSGGTVSVTGLAWTVTITDAEGANDRLTLNGLSSNDVINASTLAAGLVSLVVNGGLGNDLLFGSAGADLVNGGDGDDSAFLGAGNDIFAWNPGDDNDTIEGQAGTDTLRFSGAITAEQITISANGGRVRFLRDVASVTMDLDDTEVIQLTALGGAETITVNDLSGTDVTQIALDLAGVAGGVSGDSAIDTLTLNASDAASAITLSGASGALLTVTGLPASVTISQFETSGTVDRLTVLALGGNDTISATGLVPHFGTLTVDGGAGNDVIRSNGEGTYLGSTGDDTIFAGLTVALEVLDGGDGIDTLDTTSWGGGYTISLVTGVTSFGTESFINFENLVSGAGVDVVTGTGGDNTISTQGNNDTVNAGGGRDVVNGGNGNDTLNGENADDVLSGGDGDDALNGGAGNDALIGGSDADAMAGGVGDDSYIVADGDDVVTELAGEGSDTIYTTIGYALDAGAEIEALTVYDRTTTGMLSLYGNAFGQSIYGNNGANLLSGGGGADTLYGMGGNDAYQIDGTGDVVYEFAGGGNDTIYTTGSFSLSYSSEIELITVEDRATTNAVNLLGNALGQTIYGNAGANVIRGGGGTDSLFGFAGNDAYLVDDLTDQVTELAGGGTDTVYTTGHFALTAGSEIEVLSVYDRTTTNAINMAGNALGQTIYGNAGNNVIDGKAGADTIYLMGGTDTVYFSTPLGAGNVDAISGFASGNDRLQLSGAIFAGLAPGSVAPGAFVVNALPADADDRLLYNQTLGQLFFDADGNGGGAAILFATLDAGTALAASDFVVV